MKTEFKYSTIKKMKGEADYLKRWTNIMEYYKPKLNEFIPFSASQQFTPHNYDNHCVNIYRNLGLIIPEISYKKTISIESIFLLNVAVVLHDFAMVTSFDKRSTHSLESKKYILKERDVAGTILNINLSPIEGDYIADIVYGHSDLKDEMGRIDKKTIEDLSRYNTRSGKDGTVNVTLLAAILRLADELDVSAERLAWNEYLQKDVTNSRSIHAWRRDEIFSLPAMSETHENVLNLYLREDEILKRRDINNDISNALEAEKKINGELKELLSTVFNIKGWIADWKIQEIKLIIINKTLIKAREKLTKNNPLSNGYISKTRTKDKVGIKTIIEKKFINNSKVEIIDSSFSEKISKWVVEEKLLKFGHFYIEERRFARDWIETQKLLVNKKYLESITNEFVKYILNTKVAHPYIMGDGFPGLILASAIAFKLGVPFSYIPEKYYDSSTMPEKRFKKIDSKFSIFIVDDVIVSGNTIAKVLIRLKKSGIENTKIKKILAIFYRSAGDRILNQGLVGKVAVLNANIDIEVCKKTNCFLYANVIKKHKFEP